MVNPLRPHRPVKTNISAIILAGGQAKRMGGRDKALVRFRSRPMIDWIVKTLSPQVKSVMINASRNFEQYRRFCNNLFSDKLNGFQGPLAGFQVGISHSETPFLATVPCDSPGLPENLIERLSAPLTDPRIDLTVVSINSRLQPVFSILRKDLRLSLDNFLESGERKIDRWYSTLNIETVDFTEQIDAFVNFNTVEEIKKSEQNSISP